MVNATQSHEAAVMSKYRRTFDFIQVSRHLPVDLLVTVYIIISITNNLVTSIAITRTQ